MLMFFIIAIATQQKLQVYSLQGAACTKRYVRERREGDSVGLRRSTLKTRGGRSAVGAEGGPSERGRGASGGIWNVQ